MTDSIFQFGERRPECQVPVLSERAVRASAGMLYLMVLNNMIVCSVCLLLLFFEAAFGICIGCKFYNLLNREKAQLCPGGACEVPKADRPGVSLVQGAVLLLFAALIAFTAQWVYGSGAPPMRSTPAATAPAAAGARGPAEEERCKVPEFAKTMGHEEKWKQHNNCQ